MCDKDDPLFVQLPSFEDMARMAQEEPENRGALRYMREQFLKSFPDRRFDFVSRPASASPAVGSHRQHVAEQRELVDRALGVDGADSRDSTGAAAARPGRDSAKRKKTAAKTAKRGKA